jgi:hypothetical protein
MDHLPSKLSIASSSESTRNENHESLRSIVQSANDQSSAKGKDVHRDNRLIGLIENVPRLKGVTTRLAKRDVSDDKDDGDGVDNRSSLQSCIIDETSSLNNRIGEVHCHSKIVVFFDTDV